MVKLPKRWFVPRRLQVSQKRQFIVKMEKMTMMKWWAMKYNAVPLLLNWLISPPVSLELRVKKM
eukprot:1584907-Ditylum_brightwellii.AAC.1